MDFEIMECVFLLGFISIFFFILKKEGKNNIQFQEKKGRERLIAEYEFIVTETQYNAERIPKSRQKLLSSLQEGNYLAIQKDPDNPYDSNAIIILTKDNGYDLGYIRKEDQRLLLPYLNNDNYNIVTGVKRFYENENGINLIIYTDIYKF